MTIQHPWSCFHTECGNSKRSFKFIALLKVHRFTIKIVYINISDTDWNNANVYFGYSYEIFLERK